MDMLRLVVRINMAKFMKQKHINVKNVRYILARLQILLHDEVGLILFNPILS